MPALQNYKRKALRNQVEAIKLQGSIENVKAHLCKGYLDISDVYTSTQNALYLYQELIACGCSADNVTVSDAIVQIQKATFIAGLTCHPYSDAHELSRNHCAHRHSGETSFVKDVACSNERIYDQCISEVQNDDYDSISALDERNGLPNTNLISGDERLKLFRLLLDEFKWERQDNQQEFHEMMLKTALPCIYKDEWASDYDRILRQFNLMRHCAETFIICPRRFGKTVSVAMFCAVYMYCVPDASIAIFSTAQRTSGKMMLAIYNFMRELPYFKEAVFVAKNSEIITITLDGGTRTMACYPGTVAVCIFIYTLGFSCPLDIVWLADSVCSRV